MAESVSMEQVETLAAQLRPRDQLALVARLSARLSASLPTDVGPVAEEER